MHHVCIAITSQRLTLSTSYFHQFILYSKMHFGVLDYIRADVITCDTPWGSKLPYLRVGAVKSLQIRCIFITFCIMYKSGAIFS